jgi:hypothetical protein
LDALVEKFKSGSDQAAVIEEAKAASKDGDMFAKCKLSSFPRGRGRKTDFTSCAHIV